MRAPAAGNAWHVIAIVLGVVAVLAGLAILAFVVLVFVAMSQFGSNK